MAKIIKGRIVEQGFSFPPEVVSLLERLGADYEAERAAGRDGAHLIGFIEVVTAKYGKPYWIIEEIGEEKGGQQ